MAEWKGLRRDSPCEGASKKPTTAKGSRMGFKTYTCPVAKSCGGCEWLAVPYPIQLRRKRQAVLDLFEDLLPQGATASEREARVPIHGMDADGMEPAGYRHKAATPFAPGKGGSVRSGFYARGSHRIVPCTNCLVEAPGARQALNAVARAAEDLRIPAYDEDRGRGLLRHAVVRMGYGTDECLLTLVTNGKGIGRERELVAGIRKRAPFVTAIAQNVNQRRTNAILGHETRALFGGGRMVDELLGCEFEIGPTSFYQTNPAQTEVLYTLAIEGAGLTSGMRVLDAYCGIGTIGLCAAKQVDGLEVVGVEQVDGAVGDARKNARRNGLSDRCRFVCADATAYMKDVAKGDRERFDVVLMDPPRAGSTPAFINGVLGLAPERVVYVSCNPTTQRRDVELFLAGGYAIESLEVVDMFPHTKHAESVMVLSRR